MNEKDEQRRRGDPKNTPEDKKLPLPPERSILDNKEQQIAEVMQEETARGRRGPASLAARKELARLKRVFSEYLDRGTEEEFTTALRELDPPLDQQRFREALRIWRENRRS
jgi:hypothetical protein